MTTALVQIEKPVYGGACLARIEGKATFVPLTLPGEQVRVHIVEDKRGYAKAEVEELVAPSPERISPRCRHFGLCGGCDYQHADYAAQLRFKETILRETLERAGVHAPDQIEVLAGEPWGYRNRIRLAFDAAGNPGYRGRRSHNILPIRECPIAAPLLVHAAFAFAEAVPAVASNLHPTELSLFCTPDESTLLATVFVGHAGKLQLDPLAQALCQRIPALRGMDVVIAGPNDKTPRTIAKWGAASIDYPTANFTYRVDQGSFFQVNRWLVDALAERVTSGFRGKLAWDLYAGVGLFARKLAEGFERVVAVESAPSALPALKANLQGTQSEAIAAQTLAFLRRASGDAPDLIVVDPPRTGLGPDTTAQLAHIAAPAIVYVSCDPATLARDLRTLTDAGYELESMTLADLFPQTFHLETVVRLRRR